ncbi:MAG TPA: hypothetical protein ENG63_02090 [Candidatus Desulfofervidus auxilii]|uniref:Transporter n=1 Tax=Desulfofervidus auxilii TaxID=1621989 RepID=A0A7C0U1Q7_DESA2|nr:hypothetical protein [Candidatus Desulfofervidus auxilii]
MFKRKIIFFLFLFFPLTIKAEVLYPLASLDAYPLSKGKWELRLGVKYLHDRWFPFERKDTDRRELQLPQIDLNIGIVHNVEIHLSYFYLYQDSKNTGSEWGSGDLNVGIKINLLREDIYIPAFSLDISTKLPNADYEKRLGTDETDFFAKILLTKKWSECKIFFNIGIGILGNPKMYNAQDDIMVYGFGINYKMRPSLKVLGEISGWAFSHKHNNYTVLTLGGQYLLNSSWRIDAGLHFGLTEESEDWGISTGISYLWQW